MISIRSFIGKITIINKVKEGNIEELAEDDITANMV